MRIADILVGAIFLASLLALYRQIRGYSPGDIVDSLRLIPPGKLAAAGIFTALNYFIVCWYDVLALRYLGIALPLKGVLGAAFVSNAIGNSAGYAMLSNGTVKYRLYARWGLPLAAVAAVVLFSSLTLWIGIFAVGGFLFVVDPLAAANAVRAPESIVRLFGAFLLLLVCGYVLFSLLRKEPVKIGRWRLRAPGPGLAAGQVLVSSGDWLLSAPALYLLLPGSSLSFFTFLAVYLPAQFLGIVSQVPGGLGVFESVVLLVFPAAYTTPQVLAALVAFRLIYYALPFGAAVLSWAVFLRGSAGKRNRGES